MKIRATGLVRYIPLMNELVTDFLANPEVNDSILFYEDEMVDKSLSSMTFYEIAS